MPRKPLPHIKTVIANGKEYSYFNTGQRRNNGAIIYAAIPPVTDPKFAGRYAALCAGRTKRENAKHIVTVPILIELYAKSQHFTSRANQTQRLYKNGLDTLASLLPTAPAGEVTRQDVQLLFDNMAETPAMANAFVRTVGALYSWGRKRGHVQNRPTDDIELYEGGEHAPWSDTALEAGLSATDEVVRLAVHMCLYTAQRVGDVSVARWNDIKDGAWTMTPEKTRRTKGEMTIRLHSKLKIELARHKISGPMLFKLDGPTLSRRVMDHMKSLGHKVVTHGLRKNAVNQLLEESCSVAETAAISGQSLQMVEHYARERNQAKLGTAAILKWEKRA